MAVLVPAVETMIRREPDGALTLIDGSRQLTIAREHLVLEGTAVTAWFALLPLPPGVTIIASIR